MMKKKENARQTALFRLTLSAMLTALSVVVLYLGTLLDVLSLTAVAIASLFLLFAVREFSVTYRLFIYFGTGILAVLLLPSLETAVLYALLGLYPLFKFPVERIRRPLPLVLKLLYVNTVITLSELCTVFLFHLPAEAWYMLLALYLIANPAFFLYDRVLDRMLIVYEARLRPRLSRYL